MTIFLLPFEAMKSFEPSWFQAMRRGWSRRLLVSVWMTVPALLNLMILLFAGSVPAATHTSCAEPGRTATCCAWVMPAATPANTVVEVPS